MILVDYREKPGKRDKEELMSHIRRIGVKVDRADLQFGDAAFEGNGPHGIMGIGVERKRLHDMLNCIDDARYTGHQRVGMNKMYNVSFLVIEGPWRPHDPKGVLMEGNDRGWWECRPAGRGVAYSKLRRYLFSVQLSGVHVIYTRDLFHTAYDICELYHYFQKRWVGHTSLLEHQKLNIPSLSGKPNLVRRWAAALDGVGVHKIEEAARLFKTPIALANSEEMEWLSIPGIGAKTAQSIVAEIGGKR